MGKKGKKNQVEEISVEELKAEILQDYQLACESREVSLLGRREVLTGKAKFGIFGDGKELVQIALAKQYQPGDWRSGYYRDQTWIFAAGIRSYRELFTQLYAHTDVELEPNSGGRQMNGHFATRSLNPDGTWKNIMEFKNTASDVSCTAAQMPRTLGLAYASKFYREVEALRKKSNFSLGGNEICFNSIGDASTSEGHFWETINAAGVLQVPMVVSVWDDGHGISVPTKYHTTKESISAVLQGFQREKDVKGVEILTVKGWDYPGLVRTYEKAAQLAREEHIPCVVHVQELTQPQGHSTSGSHERYKSKERLSWEAERDCNVQFKKWILSKTINGQPLATEEELTTIEQDARKTAAVAKKEAWKLYAASIKKDIKAGSDLLADLARESSKGAQVMQIHEKLTQTLSASKKDLASAIRQALALCRGEEIKSRRKLIKWFKAFSQQQAHHYSAFQYNESEDSALKVPVVEPIYGDKPKTVDGREVIRDNFDVLLKEIPELLIYGQDSGKIGGVNQGLQGLQEKHGEHRVFDCSIRETTMMGQGIGLALRGLRPIAEIQYLDYLIYGIQTLSDDLACLHYRTFGGQKAPLIIRTRGHRLEGIWHSGSPMGMIIHALRGIHVCVPRNMTQAAGMYNTLLRAGDPAIVVESLNGYRLKETLPENLGQYCLPLGQPEIVREGEDVTIVTYGSMVRMAEAASERLAKEGIEAEVVDVQTLLPFDLNQTIGQSIEKTNRVLFLDEDVPGGASAFMMQQVLEKQGAWYHLDGMPRTLTAKEHRPAYSTDGDYYSKPSEDDIFDTVYEMMRDIAPSNFPPIYN